MRNEENQQINKSPNQKSSNEKAAKASDGNPMDMYVGDVFDNSNNTPRQVWI
jgi:hypothetical protein